MGLLNLSLFLIILWFAGLWMAITFEIAWIIVTLLLAILFAVAGQPAR